MKRVIAVFLFAFLFTGLAFSQTNLGDFTMRGAATTQVPGDGQTAHHPYLPLNSTAVVTNPVTGNHIEVTITGRIDPSHNRIIDLSRSAASSLGIRSGDNIILTVVAPTRRDPRERQAQLVEFTGSPIPIQQNAEPQQIIQYHSYEPQQQQQQPEPKPEPIQPQQQYQPPAEQYKGNGKSTEIYILPPPPQEDDGGISEFLAWLLAMTMDSRETREIREVREIRDAREARLNREARELREIRESQEIREIREAREAREAREIRGAMEAREIREAREAREEREEREARNIRMAQEQQKAARDSRTSRDREKREIVRETEKTPVPAAVNKKENQAQIQEVKPSLIKTSADSIENQMPVNRLNMPIINLPPTFRQIENNDDSVNADLEIDLSILAPISSAPRKSSPDLRVSANQANSMRTTQPPPVRPEALQILPGLPDRYSGKAYSLQIGSFSALESANRAASLMKDVGFDVKIEFSGAVYRVMAVKIAASDVYAASVRLGALGFGHIWVKE